MFTTSFLFFFIAFLLFILLGLKFSKDVHGNPQKYVTYIGVVTVVTVLVFFVLTILFPLDVLRFVTGNKDIPTSSKLASNFKQVRNAIQPLTNDVYTATSKDPAVIDEAINLVLPDKCGFHKDEIKAFNEQSATKEISNSVKIINSTDLELTQAFDRLTVEQQNKFKYGGLSGLNGIFGSDDTSHAYAFKKCALQRLISFGRYASRAQNAIIPLLKDQNIFLNAKLALEKITNGIDAENLDSLVELLYSPEVAIRINATELINKIEFTDSSQILKYLSSDNPDVAIAIINLLKSRPISKPEVINQMHQLADTSAFDAVSNAALSAFLHLTKTENDEVKVKRELIVKLLTRKNEINIIPILEALKQDTISDIELADYLETLFKAHDEENICVLIIQILGNMGKVSAPVLTNITSDIFLKASKSFHPDLSRFEDVMGTKICGTTNSKNFDKNEGQLAPELRCPGPEVVPRQPRIISECEDPMPNTNVTLALQEAIRKSGNVTVENLISHLKSANSIFKGVTYNSILSVQGVDPIGEDSYVTALAGVVEKEQLWNQITLIKIAKIKNITDAKSRVKKLINNKMFPECMKNNKFMEYYRTLGREVLE